MIFKPALSVSILVLGLSRSSCLPVSGESREVAASPNPAPAPALALASMMLRLEKFRVSIPFESAWEIQTVGDAYRDYLGAPAP
ncbi:MAG: hypothetical protein ABSF61_11185 [Anaerolineales bacterium]|jgi:hypothetical protein